MTQMGTGTGRSARTAWIISPNLLASTLLVLDILGVFILFNFSHWLVTSEVTEDLLINWKLVLISCFTFLSFYLLDLYTFESQFSQLGMLERSLIGMLLIGMLTALFVYLIGPSFIGGFVGRGVMALSLFFLWWWCLAVRYLLNAWHQSHRSHVQWLVMARAHEQQPFINHFRSLYSQEPLLILTDAPADSPGGIEHCNNVGTWTDLKPVIDSNEVAGVIVVSTDQLPKYLLEQLLRIRFAGIRIFDLNDFYERYLFRLPVYNLDQNWAVLSHGFDLIHNPVGLRLKRYLDIAIALSMLLLLSPVILLLCIGLALFQGRPILFKQQRVGENGSSITVLKFRTMQIDAETGGAQFASKNDPRVTRIGRFMRKFRIDELPQLWNVLQGEMSFIGPRPERPEFTSDLQERIPYYNLRHTVKPGLTGWAQVMYGYGDSSDDAMEKLQYDLFYIKNYSLALDFSIIIRSFKVILFGTGR